MPFGQHNWHIAVSLIISGTLLTLCGMICTTVLALHHVTVQDRVGTLLLASSGPTLAVLALLISRRRRHPADDADHPTTGRTDH